MYKHLTNYYLSNNTGITVLSYVLNGLPHTDRYSDSIDIKIIIKSLKLRGATNISFKKE